MKRKKYHRKPYEKKIFFLAYILFILTIQVSYSQNSKDLSSKSFNKTVDKVNPQNLEFPGGRGANEMVVYTPLFGDSTGTNKYGIEAIVIDNKIQSISGNNSKIPQNGFVISGHGSQLQWISKELFCILLIQTKVKYFMLII